MRKAPDKIYRNTDKTGYVCWSETEFVKPYSATAYIRKDALLEWTNKRLEEFRHIAEISNDVAADGEVDAFEELIEHIKSL